LCFNDDIQGTGVTALAGLLGGIIAKGGDNVNSLGDQRITIAIAGAGSASIGIAQMLRHVEQGCSE
jgi:malic enzyme